ncbi:hypothetical protein V1478_011813 [Vespula squamosa]|uniref:Uncharacterized protein n=1 Tax=Vespula squamosa TaxID=30214 RepID=A0ABD2AC47_VESSQ
MTVERYRAEDRTIFDKRFESDNVNAVSVADEMNYEKNWAPYVRVKTRVAITRGARAYREVLATERGTNQPTNSPCYISRGFQLARYHQQQQSTSQRSSQSALCLPRAIMQRYIREKKQESHGPQLGLMVIHNYRASEDLRGGSGGMKGEEKRGEDSSTWWEVGYVLSYQRFARAAVSTSFAKFPRRS